ncbi:MAG: hypothetical protein AB1757_21675 [Acidobacteriota bacterium]
MKIRNPIRKHLLIAIAVIAMVVGGSTWKAEAQNVRVFDGTTYVGIIPGQTLRFSIANQSASESNIQPVRAQVKLYDAQGAAIAGSREVEVSSGQFRTVDFIRENLPASGEPVTGRLQLRAVVYIQVDDQQAISGKQFPVTMEVIDTRTGGTYYTGYVKVSSDGID